MGMEAKMVFLKGLEQKLQNEVTAVEMAKILSIVSDQMIGYEVESRMQEIGKPDDLLEAYIQALTVQGRSPKTLERYQYVISKLYKSVGVPTQSMTVYHLRGYLAKGKEQGLSDASLEGERQVISAYFNWLKRESLIEKNPVINLGSIKYQQKIRKTYSEVDIEKLKSSAKSPRDKAIICFLLSSACRITETVNLNREDVDLETLECRVLGKGNKERTVYIDTVTAMLIKEYLASRTDNCEALFVSNIGLSHRMTPGGVRDMLKKLGAKSNVEHVHPHKFRRTKATSLIKRGMPIQEVASILGHEELDTTMKYVVMDKTDVKNSYLRYS